MTYNKLAFTSFIVFGTTAIAAIAATTIMTQAYADPYCGMNYQGSFHVSPGFPSLSVPPGYPSYTPLCLPDNSLSASFPISDH